jgi:hypothetical protein
MNRVIGNAMAANNAQLQRGIDQHYRLEALRLAMAGTEPLDKTMERAKAFYEFLMGEEQKFE